MCCLESGPWVVRPCRQGLTGAVKRNCSCVMGASALLGKGVLRAVEHVNTEISEAVNGLDAQEPRASSIAFN